MPDSPEQEPAAVLRFSQTGLMRALDQPANQESASILKQITATSNSPKLKTAVQKLQNTRIRNEMIVVNPRPTKGESMVRFVSRGQAFNRDEVIDTPTQVTLPAAQFFENLTTAIEEKLLLESGNSRSLLDEEEKAELLKASQQALADHDLKIHTGDNPWKDSYEKEISLKVPDKSLADMTPKEKAEKGYKGWQTMVDEEEIFTIQPSTTIKSISLV